MSAIYSFIKKHLLDCLVTTESSTTFSTDIRTGSVTPYIPFWQIQGEARAELPTGVTSSVA